MGKPPVVLVVDDEPQVLELLADIVSREGAAHVVCADSMRAARRLMNEHEFDLAIIDLALPDGSGLNLLPQLRRSQPAAAAMIVSGQVSFQSAVEALRGGAVDFVAKPFNAEDFQRRLRNALASHALAERREQRLSRLRRSVKQLNAERKTLARKVDLLCNDLIGAYSELARQTETVRVQESYRHFTDRADGLEQILCHTMDWLLRQVGYCNIGIWLTTAEQELQLGAFMKYTIAANPELTGAMQENLLRMAIRRGLVRLRDAELRSSLTSAELKYLAGQDILAINCSYLGESLGAIAMFRDARTPFSNEDVGAVRSMCPLFALALARAVRGSVADEAAENGEGPGPTPPAEDRRPHPRKDPADWWKRGEEPPF